MCLPRHSLIEFDHQSRVAPFRTAVGSRDHIHTVVRTPNGNDYGKDLLRQHSGAVKHQITSKAVTRRTRRKNTEGTGENLIVVLT